ncbi:putative mitochondrial protein [Phytophthora megakarya]|uniref:Putative mitochondrial protein n=1 Tax=Phytophthora megakarya TaxID=4795 RepID=A0A225UTF2_9STRA|nr:putative mitochondrial protein [Phytophthora megakarya]
MAETSSDTPNDPVKLAKQLVVDAAAAMAASLGVAPFITIVDRAIIENASGARPLGRGLKELSIDFLKHPLRFVGKREFHLIFGLYTATYVTANAIDSVCEYGETNNQMPKFIGTTAVNMSLCIAKDRAFARMFGVIAPAAFPLTSIGLFAVRDSMTCGASFNAPKVLAKKIEDQGLMEKSGAMTFAQLICPAAVQFVSTPLHLLGLDLYNNKGRAMTQRVSFVQREYVKSVLARVGRIGPAFGIGGVGNAYFRNTLRAKLD